MVVVPLGASVATSAQTKSGEELDELEVVSVTFVVSVFGCRGCEQEFRRIASPHVASAPIRVV